MYIYMDVMSIGIIEYECNNNNYNNGNNNNKNADMSTLRARGKHIYMYTIYTNIDGESLKFIDFLYLGWVVQPSIS